ncbi:hypothetical protein [Calycomorphotria hydatis]|uniref:DUF4760 domain-containing protein n=1 Tax=Calycomorphotria hydatis TaxID=2528027 RepID=A0A517T744_9PLAN|nr:hypothetical protein [Calycomorphotria hydatis]QDT64187.1 hypothetical protein V22_14180 [Calycomorphotria hydatis]
MWETETIAIVVTIGLTFVGYLVTYAMQRAQSSCDAKLAHVNMQLRNLYGPLYTTLKANEAIWRKFTTEKWPAHGGDAYFGKELETTPEEKERWRLWMIEVFEPINVRIEKAIIENGDLLIDSKLSEPLINMLAHIAAYRALYPKWQAGDFTDHTSLINFPGDLLPQVEAAYQKLLKQQRALQ